MKQRFFGITLMLALCFGMLSGCFGRNPVSPPTPDYLGERPGHTNLPDSAETGEGSQSGVAKPTPVETLPPEESTSLAEPSETPEDKTPRPSEEIPDPNDVVLPSEELGLWSYDQTIVGFSYPPNQTVIDTMAKYNAYAYGPMDEKKIYLSFNAGYEYNDGMKRTLDILGYYDIKATIFVDGHFISSQHELTRRIIDEGHLLGNHTMGHTDLGKLAQEEKYDAIRQELADFENLVEEVAGQKNAMLFRPPSSTWSERSLEAVRREGYKTYLFSFTHKDWEVDNQPDPEQTLRLLETQVYPGSLIMLHTVSETNVQILEDFIKFAYNSGYSFGLLPVS